MWKKFKINLLGNINKNYANVPSYSSESSIIKKITANACEDVIKGSQPFYTAGAGTN